MDRGVFRETEASTHGGRPTDGSCSISTFKGRWITAVDITTDGTSVSASTPRVVVETRARSDHVPGGAPYDVARDGRFLVNELVAPEPASGGARETSSFTVVLNFASGL